MTETPNADLLSQGGQTEAEKAAADQAAAEQAAAEKAAAEKAAAEKAAAEKAAAEQAAAEKAAAKKAAAEKASADKAAATRAAAAKPKPGRRGPPPEGVVEARHVMLLTTSRLSSAAGEPLRRGRLVLVREGRLHRLLHSGKVRKPSETQIAAAKRLGEPVELA